MRRMRGICCTTINSVLHELNDPGIVIPCQTVNNWIARWLSMSKGQRHEPRVAWHRARRRLDKLEHPWKAVCVCGSLTAATQTLRDVK